MWFCARFNVPTVLLMLSLLTSCTPAAPLNFLARNGAWTVSTDKYGPGSRNGVDIYTPTGAVNAPVIVFFYGGNWQSGDKETYRFVAASLAARGYVTIVPDYRVYPAVRIAGILQDGAQAFAWAKRNAGRFGGDPRHMFLMGHSAGAHIAAMLTLDGSWLARVGLNSRRDIAGLIGVAGPSHAHAADFICSRERATSLANDRASGHNRRSRQHDSAGCASAFQRR